MGIYDRDYYRPDPGGWAGAGPIRSVTRALIAVNVAVFLAQFVTQDRSWLLTHLDLDTAAVLRGEVWRLVTFAVVHPPANIWGVAFNMLALWWFGEAVEGIYGPKEFCAFVSAVIALGGLAFFGIDLIRGEQSVTFGAAWPVVAVMALYAFHFPNDTIRVFFLIPVPILLLVAFFVVQDVFALTGGTAHVASVVGHLIGIGFAFGYHRYGWRVLNAVPRPRGRWRPHPEPRPRLRVFTDPPEPASDDEPEPVAVAAKPKAADADLEAQLDAVLAKVAREGKGSLTAAEQGVLMRASEVYKRRRK